MSLRYVYNYLRLIMCRYNSKQGPVVIGSYWQVRPGFCQDLQDRSYQSISDPVLTQSYQS